jgi:aspartate aminotransferase-like enzyme
MSAATQVTHVNPSKPGALVFKQADSEWEFEQIHRLNYRVFAEEIRQYAPDGSGVLVDRFHAKNVYFIAIEDGQVVGMVAAHGSPPFSIESRLSDPGLLGALGDRLLEVRLLSIVSESRLRMMLVQLLWQLYCYAREHSYSHLVISGIADKASMYERLGFRRLGPPVSCGAASFIPMALPLHSPPACFVRQARAFSTRVKRHVRERSISLMPGPVEIAEPVRQAFARRPVSHRDLEFLEAYERVRATLRRLSGGMDVAVLVGSGTTANDAVSLQLRAAFGDLPGLVLVNGEFGRRLASQAARAGLQFRTQRWAWGEPWDLAAISSSLRSDVAWVWAVHLETSTGIVNPVNEVIQLAERHRVRVALDCISSLGAVPLPASGVWMSTGVSGKALGAYAGLAFVFAQRGTFHSRSASDLPASLDIAAAVTQVGPQFTVASPLLLAVDQALALNHGTGELSAARFAGHQALGRRVRAELRAAGIPPLARESDAAPCVTTFTPPHPHLEQSCLRAGFELGGHSDYLRDRGWAQIATMGAVTESDLEPLFNLLA